MESRKMVMKNLFTGQPWNNSGSEKEIQGIRSDRVPEELWMEFHDTIQEEVIKTISKKRNAKRQNGCLRRSYK